MRKSLAAILVVAILSSAALWAGNADGKMLELKIKAAGLDGIGKQMLFETSKKMLGWPLGLNLTIGAGIGSFVQGDVAGGVAGLIGDAAAYGLLAAGFVYEFADIITIIVQGIFTPDDITASGAGFWLGIGGVALWTASRIYQSVRSVKYAKGYEAKIKSAIFSDADLALLPVADREGPKVALVGSIGF